MAKKVLVLVEGQTDAWLVRKLYSLFLAQESRPVIIPYETDLYQLAELYKEGKDSGGSDFLDLQEALKERERRLNRLTEEKESVLDDQYTDRFLIFDFDPQASLYDEDSLLGLLDFFSDTTQNGKLYINYPMMESFRHYNKKFLDNCTKDPLFAELKFSRRDLESSGGRAFYKKKISDEGFTHKRVTKRQFAFLIRQHIDKYADILGNQAGENLFQQEKLSNFARIQAELYSRTKSAYVLNTALFLIADLYPSVWETAEKELKVN